MNGILFIAFGQAYDKLAAHCAAYSRKYTKLPFCVLTNLLEKDPIWGKVDNCQFVHFALDQNQNRQIKTTMIDFSPFDKTLYLDCDAIIQRNGIERVFDLITDSQILLNLYGRWRGQKQVPGYYQRLFLKSAVRIPVNIYYGALCGFTKCESTRKFFDSWNQYWKLNDCGREMPALACAVRNSKIKVREIKNIDGIFAWPIDKKAIVQHEYGRYVRNLVGCPDFKAFKPFDRRAA